MSVQLIQQYYAKVEQMIRYGGTRNESTLRKPFQDLLEQYARSKNLVLVPEVEYVIPTGRIIRPDGTLKDALRQDWGYWESKDEKDDLEAEIAAKLAKGYPLFNILFEDTHTAVLYQGGGEVLRADFTDASALDALLTLSSATRAPKYASSTRPSSSSARTCRTWRRPCERSLTNKYWPTPAFRSALDEFLELCKKAINPKIEMADVREMIIQHVLTEDIFMRVFDEAEFHRENVIARKLAGSGRDVLPRRHQAQHPRPHRALLRDHQRPGLANLGPPREAEVPQGALREFLQGLQPQGRRPAGRDLHPGRDRALHDRERRYLVFKHFGKTLGDQGVEILDPATGTGTFITELIEYLPPGQLEYKYEHEIHCNEVAILPYYIANLNIEFTYKQKTGQYKEFEHICFVDTLDNMGFEHTGQQLNFFGIGDENAARITEPEHPQDLGGDRQPALQRQPDE